MFILIWLNLTLGAFATPHDDLAARLRTAVYAAPAAGVAAWLDLARTLRPTGAVAAVVLRVLAEDARAIRVTDARREMLTWLGENAPAIAKSSPWREEHGPTVSEALATLLIRHRKSVNRRDEITRLLTTLDQWTPDLAKELTTIYLTTGNGALVRPWLALTRAPDPATTRLVREHIRFRNAAFLTELVAYRADLFAPFTFEERVTAVVRLIKKLPADVLKLHPQSSRRAHRALEFADARTAREYRVVVNAYLTESLTLLRKRLHAGDAVVVEAFARLAAAPRGRLDQRGISLLNHVIHLFYEGGSFGELCDVRAHDVCDEALRYRTAGRSLPRM